MNVIELISLFRTEGFDRVQPYLFPDTELITWLNEAQVEACFRKQLIRENVNPIFTQYDVVPTVKSYARDPRMHEFVYANFIYKGQSGMIPWPLALTTAAVMDDYSYAWRTLPNRPSGLIMYDLTVEMNCNPNAFYTVHVEGYRLPLWRIDKTPRLEVLANGSITLAGGTDGQLVKVLVNGADILGSPVGFNTSLNQTAADVAQQMNNWQNKFVASATGNVVTFTATMGTGDRPNRWDVAPSAVGSLTVTAAAVDGGVDAIVDTPEFNYTHHRFLVKWLLHRAYERPDTETMDKDKSARALAEFEEYFGTRPDAVMRRENYTSSPHRNVAYA